MEFLILLGLVVGVMSSLTSLKDETTEDTDSEENEFWDESDPLLYEMMDESGGDDFF